MAFTRYEGAFFEAPPELDALAEVLLLKVSWAASAVPSDRGIVPVVWVGDRC